METNKKGTAPTGTAPNSHYYSNRAGCSCLILFIVFLITIIIGKVTGTESLTTFGLGIGFAVGVIQAYMNLKEDK